MELSRGQDFLEARFKVLLAFRPQTDRLNRQNACDGPDPIEKLSDVGACAFLILCKIFRPSHRLKKTSFFGALRGGSVSAPKSEQARVPGKEMFKAEVCLEMAAFLENSIVVIGAVAENLEGLRLLAAARGGIEGCQVPRATDLIGAIAVRMVTQDSDHAIRVERSGAAVLLEDWYLGGAHGAHCKIRETRLRFGKGNSGEESAEAIDQIVF